MSPASAAFVLALLLALAPPTLAAPELKPGDPAPLFTATAEDGTEFSLANRRGLWTVLFFYPKAGTPGCTRQVCAFRDGIAAIYAAGAGVYGISADTVAAQAAFHRENRLAFPLLADPQRTVIDAYGARMPGRDLAQRWTFIIDPDLVIRQIDREVDPALDAQHVTAALARLQRATPRP